MSPLDTAADKTSIYVFIISVNTGFWKCPYSIPVRYNSIDLPTCVQTKMKIRDIPHPASPGFTWEGQGAKLINKLPHTQE